MAKVLQENEGSRSIPLETDTERNERRFVLRQNNIPKTIQPLMENGYSEIIYPTPAFQTVYFGPKPKTFPRGVGFKFRTYLPNLDNHKDVFLIPPDQKGIFEIKSAPDQSNLIWRTKQRIEIAFGELLNHLSAGEQIKRLAAFPLLTAPDTSFDPNPVLETLQRENCTSFVPVAATTYLRRNFVSPDKKIKITLDSDVSFWQIYLANFNYYGLKRDNLEPDMTILEIKNRSDLDAEKKLFQTVQPFTQPSISKAERLMKILADQPPIVIVNPDENKTENKLVTIEREIKFQIGDGTVDPRPILQSIKLPPDSNMQFVSERRSTTPMRFLVKKGQKNGICILGIPGSERGAKIKHKVEKPDEEGLMIRQETIADITIDNLRAALEETGMDPLDAEYFLPLINQASQPTTRNDCVLTPYFDRHRYTRRLNLYYADEGLGFMFYIEADNCQITDPQISYPPLNQLEIEHGGILISHNKPIQEPALLERLKQEYQKAIQFMTDQYRNADYNISRYDMTKAGWISSYMD